MAPTNMKQAFRHSVEEELRMKSYGCLDTAHDLEASDEERILWEEVHTVLCNLANLYEERGFQIWKH